jgi:hypothetical protein
LIAAAASGAVTAAVASWSCSSKVSLPAGGQSLPSSFNTVTVAWLPTTCSGQTFFEASTALCSTGLTYLLCDGSSYSGYECDSPATGWKLETTYPDPVASGPSSCSGGDGGAGSPHGSVYVEANVAAPAKNAVLQYRYCNGGLVQTVVARSPTGGSGAADLGDNGILDADQQLVVNDSQTLLFAINQGSDSIAAFHIASDGQLTPVTGSPFPSHGPAPASLGVSGSILIVANKASDGVRNLTREIPNYATFTIQPDGSLVHVMTYELALRSSPTQVYVGPGGGLVFGTEETGVLRGMQLSTSGALTLAPGSPVSLANSLFTDGGRPDPVWPAGLSSAPSGSVLYTGVPNYGSIAAFGFTDAGALTLLSGEREPEGSLPCWSVVSADGRYLYFANAGSDNISVWDTGTDPGNPTWLQTSTLTGGGNPWGLRIDPTGSILFVITPRQVRQIPENEGQLLHGLWIARDGTLSEIYGSPVPIPVAIDTNPLGVTVVADR